jgi:hypothetical protein
MRNDPAYISLGALKEAAARPEVLAAMQQLYVELDSRTALLPGVCWNRAECCRFGAYGHRLYVTALEVVYYLAMHRPELQPEATPPDSTSWAPEALHRRPLSVLSQQDVDVCPHASEGRCHARAGRPAGCRIFYCDPLARDWQGTLSEELLGRLRALHDELDVPYFYVDWMLIQTLFRRGRT